MPGRVRSFAGDFVKQILALILMNLRHPVQFFLCQFRLSLGAKGLGQPVMGLRRECLWPLVEG